MCEIKATCVLTNGVCDEEDDGKKQLHILIPRVMRPVNFKKKVFQSINESINQTINQRIKIVA